MDMQHREHSKHNEYTFGWIFIQEIYLITWLSMCFFILYFNFSIYNNIKYNGHLIYFSLYK